MATSAISVFQLRSEITGSRPPIVIDVRRRAAFAEAELMISGALWREPEDADAWAKALPRASAVVVYCVHGREVSQNACAALNAAGIAARYLEGGFEAWKAASGAVDGKPRNAATRWVTRERPKIDRIACPWLISRFVDTAAEFLYVPANTVRDVAREKHAVPYDVPDVHFSHDGDLCSFDAFIAHYRLADPALADLALIVRGADTHRLDIAAQAAGLAAISLGVSRNFPDDHAMLKHGMVTYDALYTWCREGKEEVHTWNPGAYR